VVINDLFDERRERATARNERLRIAHDLHDGVLQSLTGAALQLEAMTRLVNDDPQAARARLCEIQAVIVSEQRALRRLIEGLRGATPASLPQRDDLTAALKTLCHRVGRWGPNVRLAGPGTASVPRELRHDVYRLVQEGLSNITRHARAQAAVVEISVLNDCVQILLEDDGCGFPFHGRYDLVTLNARRCGPFSLKERVASLDGKLVLTSTVSGSRLEISVPFPAPVASQQKMAK
jgi:signal transduction histidine kinase